MRDYVDEIIVVDTGSTDRSVEIASSFKARVYHHPWQNDFSLHRNQSISYATGDWLLQMDADEELYPGDGPLLKELALHGGADYYYFLFYDLDKNSLVHGVFNQIRFFRHGLGMHYTRKVHNQLITCGRGAFSSIRIRHYGYDLDREKMEQKHLRTTTLLKETIAASPEEPFNYYELAASYSMHRDFKEAIDYGEKAIKLCKKQGISDGYLATAFYIVAQGHYTLGNLQEAKRTCIDALTIFPEHLDSYYILAAVFFKEGDGKNCRASSLKYLELHEKIANDPASIGNLYLHCLEKKHEICLGLGITEMKANRKKSGEKYIQESYKSAPHKAAWAEKIALSLTHAGYLSEAIKWFYIAWEGSLPPLSLRAHPYLYASIARHALSKENLIKAQEAISFIPEDARTEKLILLSHLAWRKGEIGDMIEPLSHLIKEECIDTLSLLNDLDDLGRVLYDIAEALGKKANWLPARDALALAVEVSPHLFDYQRFSTLFDKSIVQ